MVSDFFFKFFLNILCVQTMSNPCSQCSRQFENDFILKLHIEFDHQAPKFWCDQCGKQFSTRWYNLGVYNRSYLNYIIKIIASECLCSPNLAVMSIQLIYCCRFIYAKIYQISYQSLFHWIEVFFSFKVQKCFIEKVYSNKEYELIQGYCNVWSIKNQTIHKLSLWLYYNFFGKSSFHIANFSCQDL